MSSLPVPGPLLGTRAFCKRGSLGPMLCPCFLVQGASTEEHSLVFVGLSHMGSRLCVTDLSVADLCVTDLCVTDLYVQTYV